MFGPYKIQRNVASIVGDRHAVFDLARGRLVLLGGFFVLCYAVLAVRAVDLTVIRGHGASDDWQSASISEAAPDAMRGLVRDRNGALLATTLSIPSLYADPKAIYDKEKTAVDLAQIFHDIPLETLHKRLNSKGRFVWIKRHVVPDEMRAVLMIGEPGLNFQDENYRFYPQGPLAAHVLGYASVDNKGLSGIERGFEETLAAGEDLNLTIDIRLQHALRREVEAAYKEFSAKGAAGLIMDVNTGEILAAVSLPDFDPLQPGAAAGNAIFNRLSLGVYELGSVFKIFSTAAYLDNNDVPAAQEFDVREPIKIGRFTINDFHAEERILTLPEVFIYSSNIGSAKMGEAVGTERLQNFYRDLGLLTPLDFEIKEVGAPLVPDPWREVNTLTASYGHGVATTPVQLTAAVSSIINGGYLVRPHLVAYEKPTDQGNMIRLVSEKTSARIRQLMRLVVTDGTGTKAAVRGYHVGGKTGTAEKISAQGRYDKSKLLSSFIGVFPMDAPRYAIFVMVDEPKGTKKSFGYATGGWVAAPAVARVIESMAAILGIPPEREEEIKDVGAGLRQYISLKDKGALE